MGPVALAGGLRRSDDCDEVGMKVPAVLVFLFLTLLAACSRADEAGTAATQTTSTSVALPESITTSTVGRRVTTTVPVEAPVEGHIRLPESPYELEMVIGPDGNPFIGFWARHSPNTTLGAMVLIRCSDPLCIGEVEQTQVINEIGQQDWRLAAVLPSGNPAFLVNAPPSVGVYVCADPLCSTGTVIAADVQPRWPDSYTLSEVVTSSDGLFSIVVETHTGLEVVSCDDSECGSLRGVPLLGDQEWYGRVRDTAGGSRGELAVLWVDERAVAPAEGEPIIKSSMWLSVIDPVDDSVLTHVDLGLAWIGSVFMDGGGVPSVVGVPHPWNGPPFSYACLDEACSSGERSVPGFLPVIDHVLQDGTAATAMPVWVFDPDFPLDWWSEENPNEGGRSIHYGHLAAFDSITGADGLPFVVFGTQGQLGATHCDDAPCTAGVTNRILVMPSAVEWEGFDVISRGRGAVDVELAANGLPLIAVGSEDGIHLIRCRDAACSPAE